MVVHGSSSAYTSELMRNYSRTEPPLHFGENVPEKEVDEAGSDGQEVPAAISRHRAEHSIGEKSPEILVDEEQSIDAVNDGNLVNLPEIGGTFLFNRDQAST